MSYYDEIKSRNLISKSIGLLDMGALEIRDPDARLAVNTKKGWKSPWIHTNSGYWANCNLWVNIVFPHIIQKLPREDWFVPTACQSCFKVVVRMGTIKQLFALERIQKQLGYFSKCGLEMRPDVFGKYGGYFYTRSLEEGLLRWNEIRDIVSADQDLGVLGIDVKVILKRGCTEYERALGDSSKWTLSAKNIAFDDLLRERMVVDYKATQQTQIEADHVHQMWIEQAYAWGDSSVLEFLDGELLYPEYRTYHDLTPGISVDKEAEKIEEE